MPTTPLHTYTPITHTHTHIHTRYIQSAFTAEGLTKLWNELVKDGEIVVEDSTSLTDKSEEVEEKKSVFNTLLEEWTWGQVSAVKPFSYVGCEVFIWPVVHVV